MTIPEIVRSHAGERTFATFIHGSESETISFEQLVRSSEAYAKYFRDQDIQPGDIVLVILQHSPHLFYSFLGAMMAGAIPSFMPFPSAKQRADLYWRDHEALFARIEPRAIVTYERNAADALATLPGLTIPLLIARDAILETAGAAPEPARIAGDVAVLQHSSGTTGLKKGVMLTHGAIVDQIGAYTNAISFGPDDVIASWLPLYHDMGFIACFMTSLVCGTHLVALDPFEWVVRPQTLLAAIERYRASYCWLPNFAFAHLAARVPPAASYDLSSMRAFINCSEPCKVSSFDRFAGRYYAADRAAAPLSVCYALAENVFGVTQTAIAGRPNGVACDPAAFAEGRVEPPNGSPGLEVISCGIPLHGVRIEIRDADGNPVADRRIGEIHIAGPFLFDGYYRQPEKTRERLRDGWYASGDLGFTLDGELYVTGRMDDLIVLNGRNHFAHEIEAIVSDIPGILAGRVVALGVEDTESDATTLMILAETKAGEPVAESTIRRTIQERLGLSVHVVRMLEPGSLVKTTSGKISRVKNRELFAGSPQIL